jgi:hypothetical protein
MRLADWEGELPSAAATPAPGLIPALKLGFRLLPLLRPTPRRVGPAVALGVFPAKEVDLDLSRKGLHGECCRAGTCSIQVCTMWV